MTTCFKNTGFHSLENHQRRSQFVAAGLCTLGLLAACLLPAHNLQGAELVSGEAQTLLELEDADPPNQEIFGDHPEGITVSNTGVMYVGNRKVEPLGVQGFKIVTSEILRIDPDGTVSDFVTLGSELLPIDAGLLGVLGLTTDRDGNLYAAVTSFSPETIPEQLHGVWKVSPDGTQQELIPGSDAIGFPNAMVFDQNQNLFVTSSVGAVWKLEAGSNTFAPFLADPLLVPPGAEDLPIPEVGANGISFLPPNELYVANTQGGWLLKILIGDDLLPAGPPEIVAQDVTLLTLDGIEADTHGNIHGVIPGFAVLSFLVPEESFSPLVRIDPDSGSVEFTVTDPAEAAKFKTPLSLSFGKSVWHVQSVFVANGDLAADLPGGAPPNVLKVGAGVPGFRLD